MDGAGDSFLKFSISAGVIFDTLNASQNPETGGRNFGIAKFAVLSAAGKPLEYCSKYGGNLIFFFLEKMHYKQVGRKSREIEHRAGNLQGERKKTCIRNGIRLGEKEEC